MRDAAASLATDAPTREAARSWLDAARGATPDVAEASTRLVELGEARRLNTRAIGRADVEPVLRSGLDTLEAAQFAARALLLSVLNEVPESGREDVYGEQARTMFAVVLDDLADSVLAFGELVAAEAQGREAEAEERLRDTLDVVAETRALLTDLLFVDSRANPSLWLLRGSVLGAVEEMLRVFDIEGRSRMRARWHESQAGRRVSTDTGTMRVIGRD